MVVTAFCVRMVVLSTGVAVFVVLNFVTGNVRASAPNKENVRVLPTEDQDQRQMGTFGKMSQAVAVSGRIKDNMGNNPNEFNQKWLWNLTCPLPCVCKNISGSFIVNCSQQNLTSVPHDIPEGATEVILSYNQITTIPAGTFQNLTSLETLDLSLNYLYRLGSGTFYGLHKLKTLLLNDNFLSMSASTFADDVFVPLSNLKYINLKMNSTPPNSDYQYPDVALSPLQSLETLFINGLTNTTFGAGVRNLTSLQALDMSNTPSFSSVSKDTFVNFKNIRLKNLILSHCDLVFIHREAFCNLPYIDTIDYSDNQHLELKGVGISTYGLQNSTIRKIVMQRVHAQPSLTIITEEDLQYLTNTKLEELDVNNNAIGQAMGVGPILALPLSLKVIRVAWNNIQIYRSQALALLRLWNMEVLDASYQEFYEADSDSQLTLHQGSTQFGENIVPSSLNTNKSRSNGPLGNVKEEIDTFEWLLKFKGNKFISLVLPPNLRVVNCSYTYKIRLKISEIGFINSSLQHVNFAYNQLNEWIGPVRGLESIRHLDLTGNDCYNVSDTFFSYMTGLETLLIGKNKFGKNFKSDKTFYNLTAMKHLDMSNNQLETLGYNLFSRMPDLTHLQLSQNYLLDLKVNMSGLVRLQTLNLSHNRLRSLPESLCQDLDHIQTFTSIQVDITDNQFQCVCDTQYFVQWLTTTKVRFHDLNSTFCTLTNGTVKSLSANRFILSHLRQHCRSYTALIGGMCGVMALLLTIILAKIIHRQRWKLRYLCYMASNWRKRTGYQRLDSAEENPFGYDVFVSYEDAHRTFIREQVIPRLETEAGLKLCIDKRDFVPGLYITDNILHAIQSSRKTVVFLSVAFLKSKWCMYELNMARMEGIYTGRELLVLVLTEEIPTSELSAEIIDIIHKQTYIEMTNNKYGEALFWERLISAVKSN